jgi:hypothetical protein
MGSAKFKLPPDQASPTFAHISFVGLSRQQPEVDQVAERVGQRHNLGGHTAARTPPSRQIAAQSPAKQWIA